MSTFTCYLSTYSAKIFTTIVRNLCNPLYSAIGGVYLYPFRGITYFVEHPKLWPQFIYLVIPLLIFSLIVTVLVFSFVFPLSCTISIFLFGPVGTLSAFFSSLEIASTVSNMLAMVCFLPRLHKASFDAVVELEGDVGLLKLKHASESTQHSRSLLHIARVVKHRLAPFIFRELFFCLINLLPMIGTPLVIYLRAPIQGYRTHRKYYTWMMWNNVQSKEFYRAHKGDYTGFGIVCLLLQMIPGFAVVFIFTGNIGMGLWTAQNHHIFEAEESIKRI